MMESLREKLAELHLISHSNFCHLTATRKSSGVPDLHLYAVGELLSL